MTRRYEGYDEEVHGDNFSDDFNDDQPTDGDGEGQEAFEACPFDTLEEQRGER